MLKSLGLWTHPLPRADTFFSHQWQSAEHPWADLLQLTEHVLDDVVGAQQALPSLRAEPQPLPCFDES